MKVSRFIFSAVVFVMSSVNAQPAAELSGDWKLQVQDLEHEVVTTLVIQFTNDEAPSCLGGGWKQVVVASYKTSDGEFFPVNASLSYQFDGRQLSIGRNAICDAYLQLGGELKTATVAGEYRTFGWGTEKLGYFTLERIRR